jgi:hypothetical protein
MPFRELFIIHPFAPRRQPGLNLAASTAFVLSRFALHAALSKRPNRHFKRIAAGLATGSIDTLYIQPPQRIEVAAASGPGISEEDFGIRTLA